MSRTILAARRGGAAVPVVPGVQLTSGSQYIHGGAGAFNQMLLRVVLRARLDAPGPNGNGCLAGCTQFGATAGFGFLAATGAVGATRGRLSSYISAVYSDAACHVPVDDTIGQLLTMECVLDLVAGRVRHFVQGKEVAIGGATAAVSLGATGVVGINTRSNVLGSLPWGACTIVELQTSTTAPSRADILALASAPVGTLVAGAQRQWVADDLGAPGGAAGASWVDRLASTSLTIVGSPSIAACSSNASESIGTIEVFGDSIAAGRVVSGLQDGGWRRPMLLDIAARGRFAAANGQFTFNDAATPLDFDARHTAVGGQALGVATATASRLSTLAADVLVRGSVDSASVFAYAINDFLRRIDVNGQSASDAVTALLADYDTACSTVRAVRTGRIVIQNCLRVASANSAGVKSAIDLFNAALPAAVATLNGTYGDVVLADACSVITPTQADADDTGILYDGLHESAASKALHGPVMATALV